MSGDTPAGPAGPRPVVSFALSLPDGSAARLVRWQRDEWSGDRGGFRAEGPTKVHVASAGIFQAEAGQWMTWCGRPVPDTHETAASAVAGGDLCKPCMRWLVRPYVPVPAAAAGRERGQEEGRPHASD
jgi:hypothetical protein